MTQRYTAPLDYYASPGPMTDPGPHAGLFADLPAELAALRDVVQGLLLHVYWVEAYGVTLPPERVKEIELRAVHRMLGRLVALDDRPLAAPRPLERRLVGTCRDFSTLLCAMLRAKGVPARARCGFARYFTPGMYEDHWVCEVWRADEGRWALVDAQLDALQREKLGIRFDPLDVPRDQFVSGGQAWQLYREGRADPNCFGIFDIHGEDFIRGNAVRDLASLNKVETLPWDGWGLMMRREPSADDVALLDRVAALTLDPDAAFDDLRTLYRTNADLTAGDEAALVDLRALP